MPEAQSEATTSLYVPTIDTVVAQAYRRAGLLNVGQVPSTAQAATARLTLNDMMDSLAAEGVMMRAVQVGYITLVTGVNAYTVPENVYDVMGSGAYIDPTQDQTPFQAAAETVVTMKSRDIWQNLTSKSAQSRPYLGYFARESPTPTMYLWPTPSAAENGGKVRFQYHVTRPDVTNGNDTLPFERYWTEYFIWGLAARLAVDNSMDLARVQFLGGAAAQARETCKGYSKQNVSVRATLSHAAGWGNRSWRR